MANQVIVRALKRELEVATAQLLDAYQAVGNMTVECDDDGYITSSAAAVKRNPRAYIEQAQNKLTFAAANYDVVKEQLELAEKAVRNG